MNNNKYKKSGKDDEKFDRSNSKSNYHNKGGNSKGRNSKKGQKRNQEGFQKSNPVEEAYNTPGSNDVGWYAATPQLLIDSASLAFSENLGTSFDQFESDPTAIKPQPEFIPGLMTIRYLPVIGMNSLDGSGSDIVNMASFYIWSKIRSTNAGAKNYDAPDLMMYLLAAKELYAAYFEHLRVYGVLNTVNFKNRYVARYIVEALGYDYDDLIANLADFRYTMNQFAIRIGSLAVPAVFPLFARSTWLNTNLYLDSPLSKAQQYAFIPSGYYVFDATTQATGSSLQYRNHSEGRTVSDIINQMNEMLSPLISDSDTTTMSGDVEKAYSNSLVKLPIFDETYATVPVYNMEVLVEIHNATAPRDIFGNRDIIQNDSGNIFQNFHLEQEDGSLMYAMPKPMLDLPVESPTPADVMVATRLTVCCSGAKDASNNYRLDIYGTEIPLSFEIHRLETDVDGEVVLRRYTNSSTYVYDTTGPLDIQLRRIFLMNQFDYAPQVHVVAFDHSNPSESIYLGRLWEVNNYTIADPRSLQKMHETATLSEFGIPKLVGNIE